MRCACQYLNVLTNKGNFPTHKLTPNPNYIPIQNKGNVYSMVTYISGVLDFLVFVGCLETAFPFPTAFIKLLTSLGKAYTRHTHTQSSMEREHLGTPNVWS